MKKILLVVGSISLLGLSLIVSAVIIDPSMQFVVENETYTVNSTMVFDEITVSDTYIIFNETGFYISSPNSITIKLVYVNDAITDAVNGELILDFYAITTSGTVWFNISGFTVNHEYLVKRNGTNIATSTANLSGFISYSNAVLNTKRFQIYQQEEASEDSTPPEISNIARTASNPLDTDALYGWVNVSCTVTDNVAVSSVVLRIHNPGGTWNNISMTTRTSGKYYYRSTTAFSILGNYTYSIRALDSSGNPTSSSNIAFSMPPNWDVNSDGSITVLDLVFISNQYSNTGSPGWIRQDVDNDGEIAVLDMVFVSVHFGEEWWL
jgi:hypothetical protein